MTKRYKTYIEKLILTFHRLVYKILNKRVPRVIYSLISQAGIYTFSFVIEA